MGENKSFLQAWKQMVQTLKEKGLITQEQIEKGFEIEMDWLNCSGISRKTVLCAIRNIYQQQFPNDKYKLNRFMKAARLYYSEKDGEPVLEIYTHKDSVLITDKEIREHISKKTINSEEFVAEIARTEKYDKAYVLMQKFEIPMEEADEIIDQIFDEKQMKMESYAIPHFLEEMAENFGEYYQYIKGLEAEAKVVKEQEENADGPIEIRGGMLDPLVDSVGPRTGEGTGDVKPRVGDIVPFDERDKIFRDLKPYRIIKFDGRDKDGAIIPGIYTCYIYKNPQGNEGYLTISEPLDGDKETKAFYVTNKFAEDLQYEGQPEDDFWKELSRTYLEDMSRTDFYEEENTYTFKHTNDLEAYKNKIEGVIKGGENNAQNMSVRRASLRLFGAFKCKEMVSAVTQSRFDRAKAEVFGEKEIDNKTNEEGEKGDE